MLEKIISGEPLILYLLAAELFCMILLQLRMNGLLKHGFRARSRKKEAVKQRKAEIKNGVSDIPVVKFEKPGESGEKEAGKEQSATYDPGEMKLLQEMMAEFFG